MSKKVTFIVNAETAGGANNGIVLGDFNQWNHEAGIPLKKQKDGSLKATAELAPGEYQYRYFLSDGRWVNDGNAHGYAHNGQYGIENCIIKVEAEIKQPAKTTKVEKTLPATKEVKTATKKPAEKKAVVEVPAKAAKKATAKAIPAKKAVETKPAAKKAVVAKPVAKKAAVKPIAEVKKTTKKGKK